METRVALISIIVENNDVIDDINRFLHEAGKYIIGRMGIPYREKGINIISIAIDAPQDVISSLSGKIYYGFQCGSCPCGKGNESDADRL